MLAPRDVAEAGFSPELFRRPTSFFFWGEERTLVNQLVFHVARLSDPEFVWLEIRSASEPRPLGDPGASKLIGPDRLVEVRPSDLRARVDSDPGLFAKVATLDSGGRLFRELAPFVQLPHLVSVLVTHLVPSERPRVVAVANADRISSIYPEGRGVVRRLVRALRQLNITLVVGYSGPERRDTNVWDHVFRVNVDPSPQGPVHSVTCERGPSASRWPPGRPVGVGRIAGFPATLAELEGSGAREPALAFLPALAEPLAAAEHDEETRPL